MTEPALSKTTRETREQLASRHTLPYWVAVAGIMRSELGTDRMPPASGLVKPLC